MAENKIFTFPFSDEIVIDDKSLMHALTVGLKAEMVDRVGMA